MFQLAAPQPPEWHDLAPGLRGRFRVGPSEAIVFARRFARLALEADDRTDPHFAFVVGCVVWGLIEWEGVGDPSGEPAPLTADNVTALLRQCPDIYDRIDRSYVADIMRAAAEKNGSGSSPNGTSAGGRPSAKPAASAPSARTGKTSPARKRGKGSGRSSKAAPAS